MVNILFQIFDKIDNLFAAFLSFPIQNLIWGFLAGALAFLIYWFFSNQESISNIKKEMKSLRAKMFDSSLDDKSEYNALAKKNLSLSLKLLGKILLPAILSIIPVVIIALWYDMNHSYFIPFEEENVAMTTYPDNSEINIEPIELSSMNMDKKTYIYPTNKTDEISIYNNDLLVYSGTLFEKPIPYITKKKWWNSLLSNPIGYLDKNATIDAVVLNYPDKILFPKMPKIINGWELLFFVGIFISTIPLRLIFKVQ